MNDLSAQNLSQVHRPIRLIQRQWGRGEGGRFDSPAFHQGPNPRRGVRGSSVCRPPRKKLQPDRARPGYIFAVTAEQIIGLCLALFFMSFGLAGSVLPGIPSTPLVMLVAIGHRLYFGPASASNLALVLLGLLMCLSLGMDYLASMYGAKRLGATWRGVLGAVVGGMVGLFFNIPGIILGPFLGALLFEMVGGREWKEAARAGLGALLGLFVGALGKMACCSAMMALFAFSVISSSLGHKAPEALALLTSAR